MSGAAPVIHLNWHRSGVGCIILSCVAKNRHEMHFGVKDIDRINRIGHGTYVQRWSGHAKDGTILWFRPFCVLEPDGAESRTTGTTMPISTIIPPTGSGVELLKRQRTGSKPRSLAATLRALGSVGAPMRAKLPDELLEREAAAKLLGISPRTLDRWHELRVGPPRVAMVGLVRYRLSTIFDWIKSCEVAPPAKK